MYLLYGPGRDTLLRHTVNWCSANVKTCKCRAQGFYLPRHVIKMIRVYEKPEELRIDANQIIAHR